MAHERILIVEDPSAPRSGLAQDLERRGYRVVEAETGSERGRTAGPRAGERFGLARLAGTSEQAQRLRDQVLRAAYEGFPPILIRGERGTQKEAIAAAIHEESDRARRPFVRASAGAAPERAFDPERLEIARGGTLYVDEIAELSSAHQERLARLLERRRYRSGPGLEDGEPDLRVIVASDRDLEALVRGGEVRTDLAELLRGIEIEVPPLRTRREDVPILAQRFIDEMRGELRARPRSLSGAARDRLLAHGWPGDIRELKNAIERALIVGQGDRVEARDLPLEADGLRPAFRDPADRLFRLPPEGVRLEAVEETLVRQALERTGGNQSASARLLGISRDQLRYRMERIGMLAPPPKRRAMAEERARKLGGGDSGAMPEMSPHSGSMAPLPEELRPRED